jgi:ElaB/YqjD/DUF883 family membrane-anchored ribosome-binding protein
MTVKSPEEIESDIERTRERMTEDIDAIGEKFSPEHIKQRAREAVTDAKEAVVEKVQEATGEVGRKAKEMGSGLMDLIRENPLPAAVAGVSLYWLFSRRSSNRFSSSQGRTRGSIGRYSYGIGGGRGGASEWSSDEETGEGLSGKMESAKEKMQEWTSEAGEKVHELGQQARRATNKLEDFFEDSPLIAAAGVTVLGAIIGASIPVTEKENELMGAARDDLVHKVSEAAGQAKDTIQEKLSEAGQGQNRGQGQSSGQRSGGPDAGRFSSQSQRSESGRPGQQNQESGRFGSQSQQMGGTTGQPGGTE